MGALYAFKVAKFPGCGTHRYASWIVCLRRSMFLRTFHQDPPFAVFDVCGIFGDPSQVRNERPFLEFPPEEPTDVTVPIFIPAASAPVDAPTTRFAKSAPFALRRCLTFVNHSVGAS